MNSATLLKLFGFAILASGVAVANHYHRNPARIKRSTRNKIALFVIGCVVLAIGGAVFGAYQVATHKPGTPW